MKNQRYYGVSDTILVQNSRYSEDYWTFDKFFMSSGKKSSYMISVLSN